jgi:hypothetical protein
MTMIKNIKNLFRKVFGYKLWLYSNETFFSIRIDQSSLEYIQSLTEKYEPCERANIYNGFIKKTTLSMVRDQLKSLYGDRYIQRLSEFIDNVIEPVYWSV